MMSPVYSSLSALRAFGIKLGVTANNIANMYSEKFKKSRALLTEGSNGGVEVEIDRIDTQGHTIVEQVEGQMIERELSNVDLAEEIVEMIPTQRGYEANLKTIKTEDEILGSIMDILG